MARARSNSPPRLVIKSESITINGDVLQLPSYSFLKEIGRGANGVVILCQNLLLDRPEAMKIWLKLRPRDLRDKLEQDVREARNAAAATGDAAVAIYSAGALLDKYFYMTMEVVNGCTLESYLRKREVERSA